MTDLPDVPPTARWTFSVEHQGRGGYIRCVADVGQVDVAIELGVGGDFSVFLKRLRVTKPEGRQRPIRPAEREELGTALRAWLDETGRSGWGLEGAGEERQADRWLEGTGRAAWKKLKG